ILWDFERYNDIDTYKKNTDFIQNDRFIIFYYFAGPIIGFSKVEKKYFVILVPQGFGAGGSWGIRSIKFVNFVTSEKITAQNDYEQYEIDLIEKIYTRKALEITDEMIERRIRNEKVA
ncbi:MAG TPA: hypothetical protein VK787_10730, partial [Puia sp.]|nr:hypothetical protein [Puia sp.]